MSASTEPAGGPAEINPYRSPADANPPPRPEAPRRTHKAAGSAGGGRFIAAQIDHAFAVVLFLAVGMNLGEVVGDIAAGIAAFSTYLGYYFVPEWLLGTTIGKSLFQLRVQQISGAPCTAKQAAVRTLMRLVEVNPLFLGALPAGISILATERRQRLGDLLAGTIVVRRRDSSAASGPAITIVRN